MVEFTSMISLKASLIKKFVMRPKVEQAIRGGQYFAFGILLQFSFSLQVVAQHCSTDVDKNFRRAIVHLNVEKTHKLTGAVDVYEGTGLIVSSQGYLLTNNHVVAGGPDIDSVRITGSIATRSGFHSPVLFINNLEHQDLALLQIENSSEVYQRVLIGEPWNVNPGAPLCSLGFPKQQEFHYSNGALGGKSAIRGWWSTDMPSNPGESGAPVFSDSTGKVVAIKDGGYDDAQNLNLVIPINLAGPLLSQVPDVSTIPSATAPTNVPGDTLISGNSTVYNGFRDPGQSVFKFATQTRREWGWLDADLGVANPGGDRSLAQFFMNNDAPPYTDAANTDHPIRNAGIREMPTSNLDEVKECPVSDYKIHYFQPQLEHVYCVRTRDGQHWAKIKVTVIAPDRIAFDYVFQPSGKPTF